MSRPGKQVGRAPSKSVSRQMDVTFFFFSSSPFGFPFARRRQCWQSPPRCCSAQEDGTFRRIFNPNKDLLLHGKAAEESQEVDQQQKINQLIHYKIGGETERAVDYNCHLVSGNKMMACSKHMDIKRATENAYETRAIVFPCLTQTWQQVRERCIV